MKCAAGAMEMVAVCLVLMSGSQREAEQCFLEAIQLYQRERATPYASRVSLLLYDCLQQWNRQLDASRVLLTASDHETENNARAAIMLELAGQCFLKMQPAQCATASSFSVFCWGSTVLIALFSLPTVR